MKDDRSSDGADAQSANIDQSPDDSAQISADAQGRETVGARDNKLAALVNELAELWLEVKPAKVYLTFGDSDCADDDDFRFDQSDPQFSLGYQPLDRHRFGPR